MTTTKVREREPGIRETLGLSAGEQGDPAGVAKFLLWTSTEVGNLGFFGCQPEIIAARLRGMAHDIKELAEFARGWSEATKAKPPHKGR